MLLIGPTNNGKSMIIGKFRQRHPVIPDEDREHNLISRSEGTIGEIAMLLTSAAIITVETGEEAMTARTLNMAGYAGPSERRRRFERELM